MGKRCNLDYKVVDNSVKSIKTYMYTIGIIDRSGQVEFVKAYGIDSLSAEGRALDSEVLSDFVQSVSADIKLSEVGNCSNKVDLLLGSSCIAHFPVYQHRSNDLCLMSSRFGICKYVVVGHHVPSNESLVLGTVCNADIIKVTPLNDLCESVVVEFPNLCTTIHWKTLICKLMF